MSEHDLRALIALIERSLGASWIDLTTWLRETNQLDDVESMLRVGDYSGIASSMQAAASKFAADQATAYAHAGAATAGWLDQRVTDLVHFDVTNNGAVRWAQANKLELVQGLSTEQRETIRSVLVQGARDGTNPRDLARDIRDSLGLTPSQQSYLASYRAALEQGDYASALGRELSSGHSDRTVQSARAAGRALTDDQVDTAVARYRDNLASWRAETVARTESLRVAHQGSDEAIRQAVDRGNIDADALESVWNAGPRTRYARPDHQAMDGVAIAVGGTFTLPDGARMAYPGDPAGGAKHCANCRCCKSTRLKR